MAQHRSKREHLGTSNHNDVYALADKPDVYERLGKKIQPQPDGCWLHTGGTSTYASTQGPNGGRQLQAHRFVYETLVGPIPDGYHLHHECENGRCVNPAHLTPLTPSDHAKHHAEKRKSA